MRCPVQSPLTGIREAIALLSQAYDQAQSEPKGKLVAAETLEAAGVVMEEAILILRGGMCRRDGDKPPKLWCRCDPCRAERAREKAADAVLDAETVYGRPRLKPGRQRG